MDMNAAVQDTVEFLGRVRRLQSGIENKMRRIETLRAMAESTTAWMTDMPRSASPDLQRMETALCKAVDIEQEIVGDEAALDTAREQITAAVCELEDYREQRVLFGRYVECRPWIDIASEWGYHVRTARKWHDSGIRHLAERRAAHGHG